SKLHAKREFTAIAPGSRRACTIIALFSHYFSAHSMAAPIRCSKAVQCPAQTLFVILAARNYGIAHGLSVTHISAAAILGRSGMCRGAATGHARRRRNLPPG